ncbi:MAG: hypothetical protein LBU09_04190, partial [Endomicrobium sp.]|nr:hypothetical protein [Endomicrobium sp.]
VYALAKQVKPNITPQEFLQTARETADNPSFEYEGKTYKTKYFINPEKLIKKLLQTQSIGKNQISEETKNKIDIR